MTLLKHGVLCLMAPGASGLAPPQRLAALACRLVAADVGVPPQCVTTAEARAVGFDKPIAIAKTFLLCHRTCHGPVAGPVISVASLLGGEITTN